MSTYSQFRLAWDAFFAAAVPSVPVNWFMDPQPMVLKLPVRIELEGPINLSNVADRDYRTSGTNGEDIYTAFRTGTMIVRAISRDHLAMPAQLALERVRACLRRSDLHVGLMISDISVRKVGPSVLYPVVTDNRYESIAAFEVTFVWRFDDDVLTSPDYGIIEQVELNQNTDPPYIVGFATLLDEIDTPLLDEANEPLIDG